MAVQVITLCEKKRDPPLKYVIVDTPGQIEIFTWSASGAIITEAFASTFPTMVAFVIDTPRCAHPQTFMSNMLQVRQCCPFQYPSFEWHMHLQIKIACLPLTLLLMTTLLQQTGSDPSCWLLAGMQYIVQIKAPHAPGLQQN